MWSFSNPLGFLVLAAIPALLVLHMLQLRRKPYRVATLFLLRKTRMRSEAGRKLERIRQSAALWLQIAAASLSALFIAGPGCVAERPIRSMAVVIDGAGSLSAFREEAIAALEQATGRLESSGGVEWLLIQSGIAPAVVYRGSNRLKMLEAIREQWHPLERDHALGPAVELAADMVGQESHVIIVSDRPAAGVSDQVGQILVGVRIANVGILGSSLTEEGRWQVMIRNWSDEDAKRSFRILTKEGIALAEYELLLTGGEMRTVSGILEEGIHAIRFVLEEDRFALDDEVHLVRPLGKKLVLKNRAGSEWDSLLERLAASSGLTLEEDRDQGPSPGEEGELVFWAYDPLAPSWPEEAAVSFVRDPSRASGIATAITPSIDAMVEGLSWEGLLVGQTFRAPVGEDARVLLWQGDRALIFVRGSKSTPHLVFNFDLAQSNITRLPAFALLVDRFVQDVRRQRLRYERKNLPTGHLLDLPPDVLASDVQIRSSQDDMTKVTLTGNQRLVSPWRPGFFEVIVGERTILDAATQYVDLRRGDFSEAQTLVKLNAKIAHREDRVSEFQHELQAVLALLLVGCLLTAWRVTS